MFGLDSRSPLQACGDKLRGNDDLGINIKKRWGHYTTSTGDRSLLCHLEHLIVWPDALVDPDPNHVARLRSLKRLVLELDRVDPLGQLGRVTLHADGITHHSMAFGDLNSGYPHLGEILFGVSTFISGMTFLLALQRHPLEGTTSFTRSFVSGYKHCPLPPAITTS